MSRPRTAIYRKLAGNWSIQLNMLRNKFVSCWLLESWNRQKNRLKNLKMAKKWYMMIHEPYLGHGTSYRAGLWLLKKLRAYCSVSRKKFWISKSCVGVRAWKNKNLISNLKNAITRLLGYRSYSQTHFWGSQDPLDNIRYESWPKKKILQKLSGLIFSPPIGGFDILAILGR